MIARLFAPILLAVVTATATTTAAAHTSEAPTDLVVHGFYRLHQTTPISTRVHSDEVEVIDSDISIRPDRELGELSGRCVLVRPVLKQVEALRTCVFSDASGDRLVSETRIEQPSIEGLNGAYGVHRSTVTSGTGKFRELQGDLSAYAVSLRVLNPQGELEGSGRIEIRLQRRAEATR